ncbi:MAG: oligosaccharide flippase family protein [Thermodesulfobacteriota bacterium]
MPEPATASFRRDQVRNGIIYLMPVLVNSLLPFLTMPVFTRILSSEDYGVLALATIYAMLASGMANFGMNAVYNRNFFQYRGSEAESLQLLSSTLGLVIANFVVWALVTFVARDGLARLIIGAPGHGDFLFWTVCGQFASGISWYYLAFLRNSEMAIRFALCTVAGSVLNLGAAYYLVVVARVGVVGLVWGQLFAGSLVFLWLSVDFFRHQPVRLNRAMLLESVRLGTPMLPKVLLGVAGSQLDKYLVGMLASLGGAGVYSIGQRVALVVFTFMTALYNVCQPQVFRRMFELGDEGGQAVGAYLTPFAYASVAIALPVALFAQEAIAVLTPASYHGAADIVTILSMYYGLLFFNMHPQLLYAKKMLLMSVLGVCSVAVNALVTVPLVLKWGAEGAAWATLLASLFSGTLYYRFSQRHYRIHWQRGRVLAIYGVFLGSALLLLALRRMAMAYELLLTMKVVAVLAYVCVGIRIGILTRDSLRVVGGLVTHHR